MSKQVIADISCENCGHHFEMNVYVSINTNLNPELKSRILDNTFFKFPCNSCGYIIESFYEVLYHDVDNQFMVWLVKPDSENIIFMQENSLKISRILTNYRLHISRYPFQWIERIKTLELGMDPRIIELYKFYLKETQELPLKTQNDFLHFDKYKRDFFSLGRTKFYWNFVCEDGEIRRIVKNVNFKMFQSYEKLIKSIEPSLIQTSWYLIDWQFPFGLEIHDGELIQLPLSSDFIEIGNKKTKIPSQFLEVIERTGKGKEI